jgi:hypothetical protein
MTAVKFRVGVLAFIAAYLSWSWMSVASTAREVPGALALMCFALAVAIVAAKAEANMPLFPATHIGRCLVVCFSLRGVFSVMQDFENAGLILAVCVLMSMRIGSRIISVGSSTRPW